MQNQSGEKSETFNNSNGISRTANRLRTNNGCAIAEFAPAFTLFIICGVIPLFASMLIPLRFCLAQGILDRTTQSLSRCERMSDALRSFEGDETWQKLIQQLGVKIKEKRLSLLITNTNGETVSISEPARVDASWLPGGMKEPSLYRVQVLSKLELPPVISGSPICLPGLTSALNFSLRSESLWQNLSCNPETKQHFLNE